MNWRHNDIRFFERVALLGACLLIVACGDGSMAAKSEPSIASAGSEAAGTTDAPTSGRMPVGAGSGSPDASMSERDGGRPVGAGSDGGVAGAAASGSGGVLGSASASGSGGASGAAVVSGSGGASGVAAVSGSGGGGGSGESGREAVGGVGGSATAGSHAAEPGATVTLTGQVIQVQSNGNFTPYGGAEVCVLDAMPPVCATADASGMLVIELPANSKTGLTMNLPGLFPMLTPITTGAVDINLSGRGEWSNYAAAVVLAEEARSSATSMLKTMFDMNMGQADMIVFGLGSGKVTLEGTPAELKWFSSGGQFTITDGAAPLGSVLHGFTNVEPGMRTFRAENNGKPCAFDPMIWPGDEPGTVSVPIRAGWWTRLMEVRCN